MLTRPLHNSGEDPPDVAADLLSDWLDILMIERDTLIQRVRAHERILKKHGRIRRLTYPPRPKP